MLFSVLLISSLTGMSLAGPVAAKKASKKRADICNTKGYDRGKGNYEFNNSGKFGSYAACSDRCAKDTKCKSFGFNAKECLLFNLALAGNFDADKASADTYYDQACISKAPSSSSSITTTTTTATLKPTTKTTKAPTTTKAGTTTTACTVPTTLSMTSFTWFNSTHNLDCADRSTIPPNAQVCWSSTNALCDPSTSTDCTCTPYCSTGLPSAAYQPLGYGPPDSISISFADIDRTCAKKNPTGFRDYEIGAGHFDCGSAADYIGFTGDSNSDTGGVGSVYFNNYASPCAGTKVPRYEATFPLLCSRDAGRNATCTAALPVVLKLVA
ncbi:hypothetical protein CAC42_7428 [Sphaceloma murrayae]|uniref:Apple domain-containing protein n=1 Tax=Sphaceloma murrayae TaxID=2082308 RepID=A0A2K1QX05_9PEZI|nr:hypothetical protein CAC42_7428 [Sphaceloma murrayae]